MYVLNIKSKVVILQNVMAFPQNLNFSEKK